MPRPPKRTSEAYSDLPSEESAQGPRSLTPPRFFSDTKPHHSAKVGDVQKPTSHHVPEDMTATARLRLDEVSRLFPEAHRPHERKPKQDSLPSFSKLKRGQSHQSPSQDGLGVRNRLVPGCMGTSNQAALYRPCAQELQPGLVRQPVPMQQAIQCAVPSGSLGPPRRMCHALGVADPERSVARTPTPTGLCDAQMQPRSLSPCRFRSGSDAFSRSPSPVQTTAYSVPAPVITSTTVSNSRPFVVNSMGSLAQKLSTVQLGGLQPMMAPVTAPQSTCTWSSGNTFQSASVPKTVVVTRGRSVSPARSQVEPTYPSMATAYPASPNASPAISFRPIVSPTTSFRQTMSPGPSFRQTMSPGPSFRQTMPPGTPFRQVVPDTYMYTTVGPWSRPTSCSPARESPILPVREDRVVMRQSSPLHSVSVQDARLSPCQQPGVFRCRASQNIERPMPPLKTEGFEKDFAVPAVKGCDGDGINGLQEAETATCSSSSEKFSEDAHKAGPGHFSAAEPPAILTQNNEADLEEAYILSAFKRKDENEFMAKDGRKEADLSTLEGLQGQESEAKEDCESLESQDNRQGSLPSVESLRATLQALRVQDRLARSGEAPLVSTVPTVPMAAMPMGTSPAECHSLSDPQRLEASEIEGSLDVMNAMTLGNLPMFNSK